MKVFNPHYMGDFSLDGRSLRKRGLNRIGNLIVPNNNYCRFEDWLVPILSQMHDEQDKDGCTWSPSTMIDRFGKEIDNEESVLYWAHKVSPPS